MITPVEMPNDPIFPTTGWQIARDKPPVGTPGHAIQFGPSGPHTATLHLQGQHDQQSHAGGRAKTASAIPPGWSTLEGVTSDRVVEVSRTEVPAGDRTYRVTAANGQAIEARVFSSSDSGRERLASEEWQQRTVELLNGAADGYDAAPTEVPPNVIVIDELPFGLPAEAQFAIAMVPVSQSRAGQQHEAMPFSSDQVHGNTIMVNGSAIGQQSWEKMESRYDIMMPPAEKVGIARYTGVHEYGHTRAGFEDDIPLLTEMYDELRPQSLSNISTEWKSLSRYGKMNPAEAHAETFADWVLTLGESSNAATQFYSDTLEWYRLDGSLAAAAGPAKKLTQQWLWCLDGPEGGTLITKASEVTFSSEQEGPDRGEPMATLDPVRIVRSQSLRVTKPEDLLHAWAKGKELSQADAAFVTDWIRGQMTGDDEGEFLKIALTWLDRTTDGQFHLQGQHDQQAHAGGGASQSIPRPSGNPVLGYRPGEDAKGIDRLKNWMRQEFFPTGSFDIGDFGLALFTLPASAVLGAMGQGHQRDRDRILLAAETRVFHLEGQHDQASHAGGRGKAADTGDFAPITADEARGNSRAVSSEEFQRLAAIGQEQIDELAADTQPIGLDENWDSIQQQAFDASQESWGGATIEARTGEFLASDADRYALTVKEPGMETVTVPEGASADEFNTAMTEARDKFRPILERRDHYLGVFHDDDLNRIDFDPVTVVDSLDKVETIGAATRAVGGAYNFADGNGYWPPHVDDDAVVASASMASMKEKTKFKGPAEWKRQAKQLEGAPDAAPEPKKTRKFTDPK